MSLIILFGPTGAGKTYIGKLLQQKFNYYFYDGDNDLTTEMKQALNSMQTITDRMRQKFITRLIKSTFKLAAKHKNTVIAQTFIKDKYRQQLLKKLPHAQFILIKTQTNIRYQRRQKRADYPWDKTYVKKMDAIFETPKIPHQIITNNYAGSDNLKSSLQSLFSALS
ncbi:MAG: shikimate kinase [Patescibacteria group bacterium]|nr:shikimate kinase [Patescibacteria group bacterium]